MFCPCCGCNLGQFNQGCGPGWGGSGAMGGPAGMGGYGFYGPTMQTGVGPWYTGGYGTSTLPTDEDIQTRVYSNIDFDPLIPYDVDINVKVDAGEVILEGTVPSKRIKHAAGDDAWWVDGVVDVHNNLKIQKREREGTEKK